MLDEVKFQRPKNHTTRLSTNFADLIQRKVEICKPYSKSQKCFGPSTLVSGNRQQENTPITWDCKHFQLFFSIKLERDWQKAYPPSTTNFQDFLSKNDNPPDFNFLEVSNEITVDIIKNSKGTKAAGMDKISISIIKENREILAPILMHLINIMIRSSKFPSN